MGQLHKSRAVQIALAFISHALCHPYACSNNDNSIRCRFSQDLFELNLSLCTTHYTFCFHIYLPLMLRTKLWRWHTCIWCSLAWSRILYDWDHIFFIRIVCALFFIFVMCRLLLQLYKTRDEKYLLDLQRVSGPQLLFLDLCAAFLAQLRVLWFPVSAFHQLHSLHYTREMSNCSQSCK